MGHIDALPNELLESILHKVATADDSAPQDLCNSEAVCKAFKDSTRSVCWHAHLDKTLGLQPTCNWDEAAWLVSRFHKAKGQTFPASKAKCIFKLHDADLQALKPTRLLVRHQNARLVPIRYFSTRDLLGAALRKYGTVELFREHVWKCNARASKRASTAFQKGVERSKEADEALKYFDEGVLGLLSQAIDNYVVRNVGTVDGLFRRATNLMERKEAVATLLSEMGLKIEDVPLAVSSIQLFERGVMARDSIVDELSRHVALNEGLKARGIVFGQFSTSLSSCKHYVRYCGELNSLLDNVEMREFYRARMGCIDGDDRVRALSKWMQGMARRTSCRTHLLPCSRQTEFKTCLCTGLVRQNRGRNFRLAKERFHVRFSHCTLTENRICREQRTS